MKSYSTVFTTTTIEKLPAVEIERTNEIKIQICEKQVGRIIVEQFIQQPITSQQNESNTETMIQTEKIEYEIFEVGPPHVEDVVDTTGAGDAFAAGYLWGELVISSKRKQIMEFEDFDSRLFKLRMGSWCAG